MSLTLSILVFAACEETGLSVTFDQTQADILITLPADSIVSSNGEYIDVTTPAQSTLTGEMEDYATDLDKLEAVKLKTLRMSIVAPDTQTFSFISEIKFYFTGKDIPETLVGSNLNIDPTTSVIEFDIEEDIDLVEYIRSGEVSSRMSFITTDGIDQDCDMKVEMTYTITAKAL